LNFVHQNFHIMATVDFYTIFNNKLQEFIQELATTFPNISQFKLFDTVIKTCVIMDKELPLTTFKRTVEIPFGDSIDKKDENFILSQSFDEADQSIVNLLKLVWKDLADQNKDAVWGHITLLLAISRKVKK